MRYYRNVCQVFAYLGLVVYAFQFCISISLRLVDLSIYFYDALFKLKIRFKKGYMEMKNFIFRVPVKVS